jgi:hypothetical protein
MEQQPVAQRQRPGQAAIGDLGTGQHLQLRDHALVQPIQPVPHEVGVHAGDQRGGPHRVHAGQVGLRHEFQNARALRLGNGGLR